MAVQPSVLTWARTSAGLSVEQAAKRLSVQPARIYAWEQGELEPTIVQLRKAADAYNRPFAALFLEEPPAQEAVVDLPDFRRPSVAAEGESAPLRRAILRARRQQEALAEVADEGSDVDLPPTSLLELDGDDPVAKSGQKLRQGLGLDQIPRRVLLNPEELLRTLVRTVEQRGYLVIQTQHVSMDEMRGFSLADGSAPVIALNGADWPRGKVFTLLHEMVHIGVRHSGLCDLNRESPSPEERYCDAVAGAALMPAALFREAAVGVDPMKLSHLGALANGFGASAEAGLLRLVGLGLARWEQYKEMKPQFREAYLTFKSDEKARSAEKEAPLFYQLKARDLGRPFIRTVLRAHDDGVISSRDVTQLLEVSYDKVRKLAAASGAVMR